MDANRWYVIMNFLKGKHPTIWVCDEVTAKATFDEYKNRSDVEYVIYGQAVEYYDRESYAKELLFEKGISGERVRSGDWPK